MENKVKAMFDGIHMPESCGRKITEAMAQRPMQEKGMFMRKLNTAEKPKTPWMALGCCLLLGLVLLLPGLTAGEMPPEASEPTAETTSPKETVSREDKLLELEKRHEKLTDGDLQKTIAQYESFLVYREGKNRYEIIRGGQHVSVMYALDAHTPFTEYRDGRVWFVANGEELDITEEFSEEEPFTYIFTDRMFIEHYIAIGGTADNPGWLEMMYTSWEEKPRSFVQGSSSNTWNNSADERYGWETRAEEIFGEYGVHWPS